MNEATAPGGRGAEAEPGQASGSGGGSIREVLSLFGRLGVVAFGGPAAHVAMFEEEVVERRRWIDRQHFLDLMGATQLIPGPNSTEMALHVGYERAGGKGMLAAGVGFIGPAAAITLALAWLYGTYGALPDVAPFLAGLGPVVVAVVATALWRLGKKAMKSRGLVFLGVVVAALVMAGVSEVVALLGGGLLGALASRVAGGSGGGPAGEKAGSEPEAPATESGTSAESGEQAPNAAKRSRLGLAGATGVLTAAAPMAAATGTAGATTAAGGASLAALGLFFLKVGAVLYGSGYVLVAFLEADVVGRFGWLDEAQLLTAIAVGQMTPGPVLTTATFVGYLVAGVPGAVVATLAIFLPSFVFVALLNPIVPKLRRSAWMSSFLDAVNASAVALMAVVTVRLGLASVVDPITAGLCAAALVAVLRFRVEPLWLVLAGALLGGLLLG